MVSSLNFQENKSLQRMNTLAVPAFTHWFCEVKTEAELQQALTFCKEKQCEVLILGGGSNVVLADHFNGLTIKINILGLVVEKETEEHVFLSVMAGENWHDTVMHCVANNWHGIENLALIPGSVGAAPIQNIGAYGVELVQSFSYLEAVDVVTGETLHFDQSECRFDYRDSVFKGELKDKVIITRVVLRLSKQPQWHIEYPALNSALLEYDIDDLTADVVANTVMNIRNSKLPNPVEIPNAGSFFKNPVVSAACFQRIKKQYPNVVAFAQDNQRYKLAAGWLLDNAGWKGTMLDGVGMHKDQALVLTNPNHLSSQVLLNFVEKVKADIDTKYGIKLEVEPRIFAQQSA